MARYPSCQSSSPHIPPYHRGETEPQGGWGTWACGSDVSREGRCPRSATIFPLVTLRGPCQEATCPSRRGALQAPELLRPRHDPACPQAPWGILAGHPVQHLLR